MQELLDIAQALSDASRVRALMALRGREVCVCQLTELLGLATPTVSRHMALLHQAKLVESRKDGRWVYYRLATDAPACCGQSAIAWLTTYLDHDPRIVQDQAWLTEHFGPVPQEGCRTCPS
jgi:ArsR family transcriptional regulator, arsenate/arsenite/antimonite-responsive transcriptional repressor